ncbi:alpha/beta fold hydrolase [Halopiger djelfimassiliensis]|uniref:alpha/beta fold hydrolase n=1 Tax=Halopiger djelfimassiliensis TaxID=1293047 RepID=UPI000677C882|nr:alpha/beta hydrolase [Halopiger djelfimassiliensis]
MESNRPPAETDASLLSTVDAASTVRTVNGIRLHAVVAGDEDAPLVVLLHGFPEFWYAWRYQIEPLVEAGYRVLVPDQRGYNLSDKPGSVRAYRQRYCSRDIVDLIATEGRSSAHVVGHDWGGAVAWDLALRYPDAVDRLAISNAPHPTAYVEQLRSDPDQLRRSGYAYFFQLPRLPEWCLRFDGFRLLEWMLRESSAPGTFTDEELQRYRAAWRRDGSLSAMLDWYRASARYPPSTARNRVDPPTLLVWGKADAALVPELATRSRAFCEQGRLEMLSETTHWVPHERPERTTELLLEHLAG